MTTNDRRTRKSQELVEVRTVLGRARNALSRFGYLTSDDHIAHCKEFPDPGWVYPDPEHETLKAALLEVERILEPWGKEKQ